MARRKPAQSQGRRSWLSRPGLGAGALRSRSVPAPRPGHAEREGPTRPSGPRVSSLADGGPCQSRDAPARPSSLVWKRLTGISPWGSGCCPCRPQPGPPCARRADRMAGGSRGPAPPRCDRHSTAGRRAGTPAAGSFPLPRESPLRIGIGARSGAARSQPGSHAQWFPLGTPARPPLLPVRGGTTWAAAGRVLRRRVPRGLRPGDALARVGLGPQPQSGRSPRGPALRGSLRP